MGPSSSPYPNSPTVIQCLGGLLDDTSNRRDVGKENRPAKPVSGDTDPASVTFSIGKSHTGERNTPKALMHTISRHFPQKSYCSSHSHNCHSTALVVQVWINTRLSGSCSHHSFIQQSHPPLEGQCDYKDESVYRSSHPKSERRET